MLMKTTRTVIIKLLESVGEIAFGVDRGTIRTKLGGLFHTFRKTKTSTNTVDDFGWCHVHYSVEDKVEGVEFFNDNSVMLSLDGVDLFSFGFADLAQVLRRKDTETLFSSPDIISKNLGISAYGDSSKSESIMISAKGYLK